MLLSFSTNPIYVYVKTEVPIFKKPNSISTDTGISSPAETMARLILQTALSTPDRHFLC